jgi:hypothetical protein
MANSAAVVRSGSANSKDDAVSANRANWADAYPGAVEWQPRVGLTHSARPSARAAICAQQTAGVDGYCSLMGQGGSCFRMSTLSGACVLCVLVRHLMG